MTDLDLTRLRYTYSLYEDAMKKECGIVEPKIDELERYVRWVYQYNIDHPGGLETMGHEPIMAPKASEAPDA